VICGAAPDERAAGERAENRWPRNNVRGDTEQSPFVIEQVDEEGFHLVDTKQIMKPKWGPGARRGGMGFQGGRGGRGGGSWGQDRNRDGQSQQVKDQARDRAAYQAGQRGGFGQRGGWGGRGRGGRFDSWRDKPQRVRVASVEIRADWAPLDGSAGTDDYTMSLPQMEKLRIEEDAPPVEELACVGSLFNVTKTIDKASVRAAIPLKKLQEPKPWHLAVTEDPVLQKLASQGKANVFTTDTALAVLMAAPRSTISWDMVVLRQGGSIFLDVREGSSIYDTTVNETAQDAPDDEQKDMNAMTALAAEAGYINYCYSQQTLDKQQAPQAQEKGAKELTSAWASGASGAGLPAGKALRYRRFELEDGLTLVVRCELDGIMETRDGKAAFVTTKAMNEFDPKISGIDWRQKLESQRAAVLANELKNNRNKLARWTAEALLSGADFMRIGMVSRAHAKDNVNHFILQNQVYRPEEFAKMVDLKTENVWAIVQAVMKRLMQLSEDGTASSLYLMLRDPMKAQVNLYRVPADAFDFDVEDEEVQVQDDGDDSDY